MSVTISLIREERWDEESYQEFFEQKFLGKYLVDLHGTDPFYPVGDRWIVSNRRVPYIEVCDEDLTTTTYSLSLNQVFALGMERTYGAGCDFDFSMTGSADGRDFMMQKILRVDYEENSRYTRCDYWEASVYLTLHLENGIAFQIYYGNADHDARHRYEDEYSYRIVFVEQEIDT